jgi:hypothetical protein
VGPRAGLDDVEEMKFLALPELELRPIAIPTPKLGVGGRILKKCGVRVWNAVTWRRKRNCVPEEETCSCTNRTVIISRAGRNLSH